MPRRPSSDDNGVKSALKAVEQAIGDRLVPRMVNKHAQALARLGASKGGNARAAKLSQKRRSEIAKKAAQTRWGRQK